MDRLPVDAPGHWSSAEGCDIATGYAHKSRADLCMGTTTDLALANEQFMVGRMDYRLTGYQTAAKERIRWLSAQLFIAQRQAAELASALCEAREVIRKTGGGDEMLNRIDDLVDIKVNAGGGQ